MESISDSTESPGGAEAVINDTGQDRKSHFYSFTMKKMHLAAVAALLNIVALGMVSSFSAPATVDMRKAGSRFSNITNSQVTWIASLPAITSILGNFLSGFLTNQYGRKAILMFVPALHLAGWLTIAYAPSISWLYGGRLLCGLCIGICYVTVPAYLIEIASINNRGTLGSYFQLSYTVGVLITMTFGIFFRWSWLAVIGAVFITLAAILMYFMPESPPWLIYKGKRAEALEALLFLKGKNANTTKEYDDALDHFANQPQRSFSFHEFKEPQVYKPMGIAIGLMFFQQFSGISALMAYTIEIFEHAESALDPAVSAVIMACVQVLATLIGCILMDKVGRRTLYLASGVFVTVSLIILGIYGIFLEKRGLSSFVYGWIPLIGFVIFVASFSLGFGPIPYLMTPELLPIQSRSSILAIVGMFSSFFLFIVTKTFGDLRSLVSDYGTYWVYGVFSLLGCIFCWFCMPETKKKSISNIQHSFRHDNIPSSYSEI